MRLPQNIRARLASIQKRLEALSDPKSTECGVNPVAKEAVRLYVQTWILSDVEQILAWNDGTPQAADGRYYRGRR